MTLPAPSDVGRFPDKFSSFRPHQWQAALDVLAAFNTGAKVVFLEAETGCLTGDTMVGINRGGKGFQSRLDRLVHSFSGGKTVGGRGSDKHGRGALRSWNLDIPTYVQRNVNGVMQLSEVKDAWMSGIKDVYRLTTEGGRSIKATDTHPFQLATGEFVNLGELIVGDELAVLGNRNRKQWADKPYYRQVSSLFGHPHATRSNVKRGGYTVPVHRLVVEADINGMSFESWVNLHRSVPAGRYEYLDAYKHVHHKDHDTLNNDLSNLIIMDPGEHRKHHAGEGGWRRVQLPIAVDTIISIEYVGPEMTYDIEVVDAPHNFIANEFVVHNSGKTFIAEVVRQFMAKELKSLYTCTTHALQRQFVTDFDYAIELKGKRNYTPTEVLAKSEITCDDCNFDGNGCTWCSHVGFCPYRVQKNKAAASSLAVINMPYLLAETRLGGGSKMAGRHLAIVDEADSTEEQLMKSIEVSLSPGLLRKIGVEFPPVSGDPERWWPWMSGPLIEGLSLHRSYLTRQSNGVRPGSEEFLRITRGIRSTNRKIESIQNILASDPNDWVYEGPSEVSARRKNSKDYERISIKPIKVAGIAENALWDHATKWLLMSASFVSIDQTAFDLGLRKSDYAAVSVDYTFPIDQRPIRYWNTQVAYSRATERTGEAQRDRDVKIQQIVDWWPTERILIHSVSHKRTREIVEALKTDRTVAWFADARDRKDAIHLYKETPGAILVGAGLERGIDLPDDLCRVIIVAKLPWPNRGDKQINARLETKGGDQWYTMQTIRSLVQMTGRGMRHEKDWCMSYILDGAFSNLRSSRWSGMIPDNWRKAIRFGEPKEQDPIRRSH